MPRLDLFEISEADLLRTFHHTLNSIHIGIHCAVQSRACFIQFGHHVTLDIVKSVSVAVGDIKVAAYYDISVSD